jgi:hypothetical protein
MRTRRIIKAAVRICSVIAILVASSMLSAQEGETCAEKLKSAQSLFTKGQVEQIPGLLKECLRSGFKKEEQLAAFKLLIQTFLLSDKLEQADSVMLVFLKRNPEYLESPTDHSSFLNLFRTYSVKPVLQLGIRIGANIPYLTFVDQNLTGGNPGTSDFTSDAANFFLSAEAKFRVAKKFEIGIGAGYSSVKFTNIIDYLNTDNIKFAQSKYIESQQRIEIPASITWDIARLGKFTPYARAGLGAALNISTAVDASLEMEDKNNPNSRTGETLKRNDSRAPVDIFGQLGCGIKFKIPKGYFFGELRTNLGIMQQTVTGGDKVDFLRDVNFWADPGFRLNTFNMNLGYTYIFYKPSKKRT